MSAPAHAYRGRFAPSPTGPLHFGSLVAAVGTYLQARGQGGDWLVRMEDIDPPREPPGAADAILAALEAFGLEWDGPVLYQSTRLDAYREALDELLKAGLAYPCTCSRRDVEAHNRRRRDAASRVYPGLCRNGVCAPGAPEAMRLLTAGACISFVDGIQGELVQDLEREIGDFVLWRRDGLVAYQLAVVCDDAEQNITEVVRGCDLLDNTPRQILLQRRLGLPRPAYLHLPVVLSPEGAKLSKQTGAIALDGTNPSPVLFEALRFLGMRPDEALRRAPPAEQLAWARTAWDPSRLAGQRSGPLPVSNALAAAQ